MAGAGCVEKWCFSAWDGVTLPPFRPTAADDACSLGTRVGRGRPEFRHLPGSRLRIDLRPVLDEEADDLGMARARGEHECGLLILRIASVHRRASLQQAGDE